MRHPKLLVTEAVAMSAPIAVRLPDDVKARLTQLAKAAGRSETHYIREAVLEHLDDLEDAALAAERWREHLLSDEPTVTLEELVAE